MTGERYVEALERGAATSEPERRGLPRREVMRIKRASAEGNGSRRA